jgi:hexokinase
MQELMKRYLHEIDKGLKKKTHPTADIKCFITYVQDLPNGKGKHESPLFA